MTWFEAFDGLQTGVASRGQLLALGATGRMLTAAVRFGHLIRARQGVYVRPGTHRAVVEALRVGGRLACASALRYHGVFAVADVPHVHLRANASRLRSPRDRRLRLADARDGAVTHWDAQSTDGDGCAVGIADALRQVALCQPPVLAVASIDNALFLGKVTEAEVRDAFARLPAPIQALLDWVDGRAEAGQETVLRRLLHDAGWSYELQVVIPGVGRVDLVVEGVLILEADSRLAHEGWAGQRRDRARDLAAAKLGYVTLRPAYEHTMHEPGLVADAIAGVLARCGLRPVQNSGDRHGSNDHMR